ncbi:hypothetical protein KP509_11G027100 [Ceratopteris richardii]|uniref:HECT-type E3 ubiquitin transferase n=1 Tax=Ceratopteris richardii TaxID=49495 RepID=A0A8T2TSY7_CERRI|nr:hypothetical protein KP509_11G027100 [Ceratopteris richardii]
MEEDGNGRSMENSLGAPGTAVDEKDSVIGRTSSGIWPNRHSIIRMAPVKRKLEELELGTDCSGAQGRARRENRDVIIDEVDSFDCDSTQGHDKERGIHVEENRIEYLVTSGNQDLGLARETIKVTNFDMNEEVTINKPGKELTNDLEMIESALDDAPTVDLSECSISEINKMRSESIICKGTQLCDSDTIPKTKPGTCFDDVCQEIRHTNKDFSCDENVVIPVNEKHLNMPLQFFVRTYMDGRTIVLYGNSLDTIESVHRQIFLKTGLPLSEQRLIYFGRQLQQDQTLADCHVTNDATLHLVARMRSTALPHSWQLINDLVATIRRICTADNEDVQCRYNLIQAQISIRACLKDFLKLAMNSASFSEHIQILQLAGATSALVMLLLSPIEANGETAEESMRLFFCGNEDYLPAQMHSYCVPVLLDFCKLLARSAPAHPIYPVCRNALACLLDTTGPVLGSSFLQEVKPDTILQDFAHFVDELSKSLCSNLQWTATQYSNKGRSSHMATYVKDAQDFTAFATLICKAFEALKGLGLPLSSYSENEYGISSKSPVSTQSPFISKKEEQTCFFFDFMGVEQAKDSVQFCVGSQRWLRGLFQELLESVDRCWVCIKSSQERGLLDEKSFWWAPFLIILKGLHSIARVVGDTFTNLVNMVQCHESILNMLIKHSRWQDDHSWLFDYKHVLNFESRRKLAMAMLPEPQDDHEERQEVAVSRSNVLSESFEMLAYSDPDTLQGGISLEFISEEATGPGVLREWFLLICREIFNPQNALFKSCSSDGRRVFPNPASSINPGHLMYFRFCGRVIALALMHRVQVNVAFSTAFFKQLAGCPVSWKDTRDTDPVFYESCLKVLDMDAKEVDADALGLTFVYEEVELGQIKTVELCSGGKNLPVNSENRLLYLEYLVEQRFVNSVAEQVKSFSQGFSELLSTGSMEHFLQGLEVEDFNLILHGNEQFICLEDWKLHTEYHEYSETDNQIIWFWQVHNSELSIFCFLNISQTKCTGNWYLKPEACYLSLSFMIFFYCLCVIAMEVHLEVKNVKICRMLWDNLFSCSLQGLFLLCHSLHLEDIVLSNVFFQTIVDIAFVR